MTDKEQHDKHLDTLPSKPIAPVQTDEHLRAAAEKENQAKDDALIPIKTGKDRKSVV